MCLGVFQNDVLHCHPDQRGGIDNVRLFNNFDLAEKSTRTSNFKDIVILLSVHL